MIKKILKFFIAVAAIILTSISLLMTWNLRIAFTKRVCSAIQNLQKKFKFIDNFFQNTVEDHGL